ncbi:MAG: hypothetical protein D6718_09620 [Acidobacteria bacterium]|nr:MAG: hypothetical protein D6718_09620 [Acidobacteriota bacterium]
MRRGFLLGIAALGLAGLAPGLGAAGGPDTIPAGAVPSARVSGVVETWIPACGSNQPPVPVPGVPVEAMAGGLPVAATTTDPGGAFELAIPARVPVRLRVLLPFDFPLVYEGLVAGEERHLDLGPVAGTVRFEPGLVAVRFAPEAGEAERAAILAACRLDPDGTLPGRQLARTRNGEHVVEAIACLLRFAPRVTGAEPGRYFEGCGPASSFLP